MSLHFGGQLVDRLINDLQHILANTSLPGSHGPDSRKVPRSSKLEVFPAVVFPIIGVADIAGSDMQIPV